MTLENLKFKFSHISLFKFVYRVFKISFKLKKIISQISLLSKNRIFKKSNKQLNIFAPIIESSHPVFFLTLILLKYLEMRGHKIILLFCDQSLSACEIKNYKTYNQKYVCSTCKFNRNKIASLFNFKNLFLSDYNSLKENGNIPPIDNFEVNPELIINGKKVHQILSDSVIRFFYGNYDKNSNLFKKTYYENLISYIWLDKVAKEIDKEYKVDKVISFMSVYSSWSPFFEYFNKDKRFISLSLNQFKTNSITVNYHELYPSKERYYFYKKNRKKDYLDDNEKKILDLFINKRFSNKSDIFVKDNYFISGRNLENYLNINKNKKNIFLFSNVFWDIGVSESDIFFNGVIDWIIKTIKFTEKKDYNLYIKPHPAEISAGTRSLSGIESIIKAKLKKIPDNIFFIKPQWKINTYDLFEYIDIGLIYSGTLGLELLSKNIPVISAGRSPAYGLGLMYEPKNFNDYSLLLEKNLKTTHDENSLNMFLYFYFIKTNFPWVLSNEVYFYKIEDLFNIINDDFKSNNYKKNYYFLNYLLNFIEDKKIPIDNW